MKKILIFIDHDIIIRNFYKLEIFTELQNFFKVKFIGPNHKRVTIKFEELNINNYEMITLESKRIYDQKIYGYINRLYKSRNYPKGDKKWHFEFFKNIFGRFLIYYQLLKTLPIVYQIWSFLTKKKIGENFKLKELIKKENPDLILHPTVLNGLFVDDLISIANNLNIPTLYLMNSWDNTRSKNFTTLLPNHLFVWGEDSKMEAMKFLQMKKSDISIAGPAYYYKQDEVNEKKIENFRSKFCEQKDTFLLCYAGSSKALNELNHLKKIDEFINNSNEKIKVLYRPHPWKQFHKSEKLMVDKDFKNIFLDPYSKKNYLNLYKGKPMNINDVSPRNISLVINSVDAVISPMSTLLLDAAAAGKPTGAYKYDDNEGLEHFKLFKKRVLLNNSFKDVESVQCNHIDEIWNVIMKLKKLSKNKDYKNIIKKKSHHIMNLDHNYFELLRKKISSMTNPSN